MGTKESAVMHAKWMSQVVGGVRPFTQQVGQDSAQFDSLNLRAAFAVRNAVIQQPACGKTERPRMRLQAC